MGSVFLCLLVLQHGSGSFIPSNNYPSGLLHTSRGEELCHCYQV